MVDARADLRLDAILFAHFRPDVELAPLAPAGAVLGPGRVLGQHRLLPLVGLVSPHRGFVAVEQRGQRLRVVDVGAFG